MSTPWTDEEIAKAKAWWREGRTATWIAMRLGTHSRNSVIGQAHRRLWPHGTNPPPSSYLKRTKVTPARTPRVSTGFAREINRLQNDGAEPEEIAEALSIPERYAEKRVTARRTSSRKPTGATKMDDTPIVPVALAEPTSRPVRLIDSHDGQCKFPVGGGSGPDLLYCGAPNSGATPYCRWHNTKAYNQTGVKSHEHFRFRA